MSGWPAVSVAVVLAVQGGMQQQRAGPGLCARPASRRAVVRLASEPSALELANGLFDHLDRDKDGVVDRAELYAYTKGTSRAFAEFARGLLGAETTRATLLRLPLCDLVALKRPGLYDAFAALKPNEQGFVDRGVLDDLLAHPRLDEDQRERLSKALSCLDESTAPTIIDLYALTDKELSAIHEAAIEAARTGYRPPEECETAMEDDWEKKLIMEARRGAGGMNVRQNEVLREAIRFNNYPR